MYTKVLLSSASVFVPAHVDRESEFPLQGGVLQCTEVPVNNSFRLTYDQVDTGVVNGCEVLCLSESYAYFIHHPERSH